MPTGPLSRLRRAALVLPPGSFLFTTKPIGLVARGIEYWTGYPETHVAILFDDHETNRPWVYEAYPPRARKMPLPEYMALLEKWENRFFVRRAGGLRPVWISPPWLPAEVVLMHAKAEELLGTPYRLALNYFRGNDRAMHCSEYAGAVAAVTGRIEYEGHRESPGGLMRKLQALDWDS